MSEMVERVARAICAAYGDDFDDQPKDLDALRERNKTQDIRAHDPGLPTQDDWRECAKAAIEAMRAPTAAMVERKIEALLDDEPASEIWSAMIDAALAGEGPV